VAKPGFFSFSIKRGDPVRLATAIRDIVQALEPLTDVECGDVLRAVQAMYAPPESHAPRHDLSPEHARLLFRAAEALRRRGMTVDHLTLAEELKERGDLKAVGGPAMILGVDPGPEGWLEFLRKAADRG